MSPVGVHRDPPVLAPRGSDGAPSAALDPAPTPAARRRSEPKLWLGVSQILSSHVVLAIAGVSSLPVLARNFGPANYGDFSLFVTVLGVVTYQDFARQLMVHEQAKERASERDLAALTRLSTLGLVALALAGGVFTLEPASATVLLVAALLHGLASRGFATLSVTGRVGAATAVRNCAWSFAFASAAAISFVSTAPLAYTAPFALANLGILLAYRRLVRRAPAGPGSESGEARLGTSSLAELSGWAHLRQSPKFAYYKRETANLLSITIACSVLVSAERLLLKHTAGSSELGFYTANCDLALKVNVLGTALANALFPMLARAVHERGYEHAARAFVRIAGLAVLAGFVGIGALLFFDRRVVALALGPEFAAGPNVFALMLAGVFVQGFGFLCTPWQRARGDFTTQRHAATIAAVLMIGVGAALVPLYGVVGALIAFLCARLAEVLMAVHEARRLPREVLPAWKLAVAASMVLLLASIASWHFASSI
jgi:O-antigen/teichoic acid export membrane protein